MKNRLLFLYFLIFINSAVLAQNVQLNIGAEQASVPAGTKGTIKVRISNESTTALTIPADKLRPFLSFPSASIVLGSLSAVVPAGWDVILDPANQNVIRFANTSQSMAQFDVVDIIVSYTSTETAQPERKVTANTEFNGAPLTKDDPANNWSETTITVTAKVTPVRFGKMQASNMAGVLKVSWSSLTETNNDRFIIELSNDGKTFVKMDSLKTSAPDGFSDKELEYSYSKDISAATAFLGWPQYLAVLVVCSLVFTSVIWGRKKSSMLLLGSIFIFLMLAAQNLSCRKKENAVIKTEKELKLFVRIAQVDKDEKVSYSKVVQVVNE